MSKEDMSAMLDADDKAIAALARHLSARTKELAKLQETSLVSVTIPIELVRSASEALLGLPSDTRTAETDAIATQLNATLPPPRCRHCGAFKEAHEMGPGFPSPGMHPFHS